MKDLIIIPAKSEKELEEIAVLAESIWHEHFTPIIGENQVNYMVEKFQSLPALKQQTREGYEYFQLRLDGVLAGYTGVHDENGRLFLSKLYLKKEYRGQHLATQAFEFLRNLCRKRGLSSIWLTCNRHNEHTLDVYHHLGLVTTRTEKTDIGNGFFMDDYILEYQIA